MYLMEQRIVYDETFIIGEVKPMLLKIHPATQLKGSVTPPASKSHTIRALFIALLAKGRSTLTNALMATDSLAAIDACRALGASISIDGNEMTLDSVGLPFSKRLTAIDAGNSGLTAQFLLPLLGFRSEPEQAIRVNSGAQMRTRPIASLIDALRNLGLHVTYLAVDGYLPLSIKGSLQGGIASVSGVTSQYLSALLLALPCAPQNSTITVKHLAERPYLMMTLHWLDAQGIHYQHQRTMDSDTFTIQGGQHYQSVQTSIPGDFSSASYLIAAAVLLPGTVRLKGLNMTDVQGDKALVTILQQMGADIVIEPEALLIRGGKPLMGCDIDARDIPDLVPTLAVIATKASGYTQIRHVAHARIKETDRLSSMFDGLTRMGANITMQSDGLSIENSVLHGVSVKGYGDHRTVMALSIAGLIAIGHTVIDEGEAIDKTFPGFIDALRELGATIEALP